VESGALFLLSLGLCGPQDKGHFFRSTMKVSKVIYQMHVKHVAKHWQK